jgi:2-desacetyl-2-hydroxyethyl bacteriochlorophyllide A dehydrogenase
VITVAKVVRFDAPRSASVIDAPEPEMAADQVRIRTLYSGISAGTELTAYRGTNPYLNSRWDDDARLFVPGKSTFAYPVDGWGYEEVGEVIEVGTDASGVHVGDVIWGAWGHREIVVRSAGYASARILPTGAPPIRGIFSHIGAIALNGVLDADIHVGETAAVFGVGVPGQLVAQLARLNGARVIAVDREATRLEMATQLGAHHVIDATGGNVAEQIRDLTDGHGADVCLEYSGAYPALHEAIRSVAYSSRVVVGGFFQGDGQGLRLGEEAHHNRVQLTVSQISGVAPHLQHRWDEYRLQRTAIELAVSGRLDVEPLISRRVPADEAPSAFDVLDRDPSAALQIVLEY